MNLAMDCFRYYDPYTGRFLQQDPDPGRLQIPITVFNQYAYVGNAPSFRNDPTGKFWQYVILAVVALAQTIDYNRNHGGGFLEQFAKNYVIDLALYYLATSLGVPPPAATSWLTAIELGAQAALVSAAVKEVGYEGSNRRWWSEDTFKGVLALLVINDISQINLDAGKPDSADQVWQAIGVLISPIPSAK